jgi:leader peptidase (prepilin peptidase)/N-methyltransferase
MNAVVVFLASGLGAGAGFLVPRAVYRLAVEWAEPCRTTCPEGHALGGKARGWLGTTRCLEGPKCSPYGPPAARVAVLTSVAYALVAGAVGPRPELAVWLLLIPGCVALALVDREVHRLPDILTLPLTGAALALLAPAALFPGHQGSWLTALLGSIALGTAYLLMFLIHPEGTGLGDVKLGLLVGSILGWYGWTCLIIGAILTILLFSLYCVALLLLKRADRTSAVSYGPMMLFGAFLALLLSAQGVF